MDRNRPMADGRDLLESELQELVRDALVYGWRKGSAYDCEFDIKPFHRRISELLVSHFDREASDVGAQDEASEARAVGDGVRPETYINFEFEGERIPIGTCDLNETDGGEIHMRIKFF